MKTITSAIKKNKTGNNSEIHKLLKLKYASEEKLIRAITSLNGIDELLSSLTKEELIFLQLIYSDHDGINFGEIEKAIDFSIESIEKITNSLSKKLLIYPIKNRQLLTKKMDKIYAIEELYELIKIKNPEALENHFRGTISELCRGDESHPDLTDTDTDIIKLMNYLVANGTAVPLRQVKEIFGDDKTEILIEKAQKKEFIKTIQIFEPQFTTYLLVNKMVVQYFAESLPDNLTLQLQTAENGFKFLINLLLTYDVISTYGLFLTKQNNYRKIDIKRISEAQIRLKNIDGTLMKGEDAGQFSLHILSKLDALHMHKDIAEISLRDLKEEISNPIKFLIKVIDSIDKTSETDSAFLPPFQLPEFGDIKIIISALSFKKEVTSAYLETVLRTWKHLRSTDNKNENKFLDEEFQRKYHTAVNFLNLTGIIKTDSQKIQLTDDGKVIAELLTQETRDYPSTLPTGNECLYINADFSLLIPSGELPAQAIYHLLSHVEITKEDVILHGKITRNSIIKARKRGISLDNFIQTLDTFSKNKIPQNLNFLLNEWSEQIIEVTISSEILLKTNHPSLIDEILHSEFSKGIVERISQNYAIVDRDFIDEIVKIAKKREAVITLFEEK